MAGLSEMGRFGLGPSRRATLVHLDDEAAELARLAARAAGAVALAVFVILVWQQGIPRSIQPRQWEILSQLAVLAFVSFGYIFAYRWELVGALAMLSGSVLLGTLASIAYAPDDALYGCLAFAVPGLLFLLHWQRSHSPLAVASVVVGVAALLIFGRVASAHVYDYYYGPTHPTSQAADIPVDLVDWIWAGGVTPEGFVVKARLASDEIGPLSLSVVPANVPDGTVRMVEGQLSGPADETVTFTVSGLQPDTEYRYSVQSGNHVDAGRVGTLRTFPAGPRSFTVALGACIRTGSNGQVFDRILAMDPSLFLITGDFHYEDVSSNDPDRMRAAFERNLEQPGQQRLYLNVPITYVWDDHDFGGNDSSAVADSRFASRDVYADYVPHYPLLQSGPVAISQAFTLGRVRFIMLDTRSGRTPDNMPDGPDKTMLGSSQLEWFKSELMLANGEFPLIVVVSSVPWISEATDGGDDWGGFATERREIANFISDNDINGVVLFGGDAHMLAIDDGTNSDYSADGDAALPVFQAGALDRRGTAKGGPYSEGEYPGGGQFGVMTVIDTGGPTITVQWTGLNWKGQTVVSHTFETAANP